MSDKKLPKIKHNHTLTDILKASIFSLVMMAPVTAIGVTCAYVVCNKNAYQSYSDISKQSLGLVSDNSYNIPNLTYMISLKDTGNEYSQQIQIKNSTIDYNYIAGVELSYNVDKIQFYPNNAYIRFIDDGGTFHNYQLNDDKRTYLNGQTFVYLSGNLYTASQPVNFYSITYTTEKLDNVFYYAVDTMQNNTLFSWTKTTAIYTPVNAMTTGMGITTPAIAVVLVYWLLCTAVYIIIDIVVKGFTWLTHLIGER